MYSIPHRCPKCPRKRYYGRLVTDDMKSVPKCPHCSTVLVPVR